MTTEISPVERLLNIHQVATWLRVSTKTVRRLLDAKAIRVHRVGGQLRFLRADVETYLASTTTEPAQGATE